MGYISIYYNIASQDKANYTPPLNTTERYTVLFSSFYTVVEKRPTCFILIPRVLVETTSLYISSAHFSSYEMYLFQTFVYDWFIQQNVTFLCQAQCVNFCFKLMH